MIIKSISTKSKNETTVHGGHVLKKFEIENYLDGDLVKEIWEADIDFSDFADIPKQINEKLHIKPNKAKRKLSPVFEKMTLSRLEKRDPNGEIKGIFERITQMLH